MTAFTDVIIYVPNFSSLVSHMKENFPEFLLRCEEGVVIHPPTIVGFNRTPAVVKDNKVLVYARLREEEMEQWQNIPYVEILAQAPFEGKGTSDSMYQIIFNDKDKHAKYKSVYDYSPREEEEDEEGGVVTIHPPRKFGILAGA